MNARNTIEYEWPYLLSCLPPLETMETEARTTALIRRRKVESASSLLRLALVYGFCGLSLRQTAAWAEAANVASITDVALMKRLRNAAPWLGLILGHILARRSSPLPPSAAKFTLRLIDATTISKPGSRGTDWRIHLGFNPQVLAIDHIDLTDSRGGETLTRFRVNPRDLLIGDRGYAHRRGFHAVVQMESNFIVRLNWQNVPLLARDGGEFDLLVFLRQLPNARSGQCDVLVAADPKNNLPALPARLVAIRKTEAAAEISRQKLLKDASKKKRSLDPRTLEAAAYVFVLTNVPSQELSAPSVLEVYRFRWQIELAFKRMKSLLFLDQLPAKDAELARAFLYSKLIAALLLEDYTARYLSFFPWGYPLAKEPHLHLADSAGAAFQYEAGSDGLGSNRSMATRS